jgi:hypothetical protein
MTVRERPEIAMGERELTVLCRGRFVGRFVLGPTPAPPWEQWTDERGDRDG